MRDYKFTSESVSEGHPDKICDQISDGILDALLSQDKEARVACEVLVKTAVVVIAGEIRSAAKIDHASIARQIIRNIGYTDNELGFDADSCGIISVIDEQSKDIAKGVDESMSKELGAGDQGMMFGYACRETDELMPASISVAHKLMRRLALLRQQGDNPFLRPDAKSQVTVRYENGKLRGVDSVVVSTQHHPDAKLQELREYIIEECVKKVIPASLLNAETRYFTNTAGSFTIGGPKADCGLTGRKIIVDTYGGHGSHGGGAFSGKDPSKIDRTGAYLARYIAKNLVRAGACEKCLVQLAYVIGDAEPVSVHVDTYGTGADYDYPQLVREVFPLKPKEIIEAFSLLRAIYLPTATYGHFGGEDYPWEQTDRVEKIKQKLLS